MTPSPPLGLARPLRVPSSPLRWCLPLLLPLLLLGCDSSPSDPADGGDVLPVLFGTIPDFASDPAWIEGGMVEGNVLALNVRYEGGCTDHLFRLVVSGGELLGHVSFTAGLFHDARGDDCRTEVRETLWFDLRPLQRPSSSDRKEVPLRVFAPRPPGGDCAADPEAEGCFLPLTYKY